MKKSEVKKIARLAKLSAPDTDAMTKQFDDILTLMKSLDEAGADDLEPLSHPVDLRQRQRDDEITEIVDREFLQSLAPETSKGFYLIPRVIEK